MGSHAEAAPPEIRDHAGVAFPPPVLLAVCLLAALGARWIAPAVLLPAAFSKAVGPVLTVAAFALFFWAVQTMRRAGASLPTHTPTSAIVAAGPYRFSRNPIYLSMVLLQFGVGIWANSPWFFVFGLVCAVLLSWGVISREERYLARKFGPGYAAYRARVRRWI